jgi:hypothetical protein
LFEKDQAGKVAYKSRASITAERQAVYRYRHNLTLSEEQMRIIKYLRLTKSRYEFDKAKNMNDNNNQNLTQLTE